MSAPEQAPERPAAARRRTTLRLIGMLALAIALLLAALFGGARYSVLTPRALLLIEASTDGLRLGRLGRLKVEGLTGDIWRDFRLRRLTVRDEQGVWLEARNVHLTWRYAALLRRTFQADLVEADSVRLIRRPTLTPKTKDRGLPVSFHVAHAETQVEMLPAFSYRRGLYRLELSLDVERRGRQRGALRADSLLHAGDHLRVDFDLAKSGPLRLVANAVESQGGALAGAAGLSATQPFQFDLRADGSTSRGQFRALATSGSLTPISAVGAWNPAGGQAGGRVRLSASTLTTGLARRLGEEAVFGVAGERSGQGLYALNAVIRSPGLAVRASGFGNVVERRLGPQGLQLDLRTPSLSRLVDAPSLGPAVVTGVVDGQSGAWAFKGLGQVSDTRLGAYQLARITGPISLAQSKAKTSLTMSVSGAGGRGEGLAAALLGGAPHAEVAGDRLANGQILLRRLDVTGRGLKVQASGSRGLTGGLSLKGQAQISNLAAARPGASGAADLRWVANQSGPAQAWKVVGDAQGRKFALGYGELDRLVGAAPRVRAEGAWRDGRLSVTHATLDGAALDATVVGEMAADRRLAFKADWTARGPFRAGPIEVTGDVKGTGAVTGKPLAPRLDLTALIPEVDLPRLPLKDARVLLTFERKPDGSVGALALTANSEHGPARARSDFQFPKGGVDLTALSVDAGGVRAEGAVSLRNRTPSAADLTLDIGPGAFLAAGRIGGALRIVANGGPARAILDLRAENARWAASAITLRRGRLRADGPLAKLPYDVVVEGGSQQGAWAANGKGTLADADGYRLTFNGAARVGKRDLRTTEAAVFTFGDAGRTARLRLAESGGGRLDLDGALVGDAADLRAQVSGMSLTLFNADLDGRVSGTLTVEGRGARLDGVLNAKLEAARARGVAASQGLDGALQAKLSDNLLVVDATAVDAHGLKASTQLALPTEASAAPFRIALARKRPLQGRFAAEGEVRPLWDLLVGGDRSLTGHVLTEGTLGGTLADPTASGRIAVDGGRFDDGASGLSLRDVSLRADFERDAINVTQAQGVDGRGGRLDGQGRVSLLRDGVSSFRLNLRGFRLIDNETATASASGQATITRAADGQVKLSGDLTIDKADVAADPPAPSGVVAMDVVEINRPDSLPAALAPHNRRGDGWALDVNLRAPRRVFLRGRGLDIEFSLDAHVSGTTTRAELSGAARVVRGDYDFAGKRFAFDDRGVVYLSTRPQNIRLQLDATREDPTLTVVVRIRGSAARPEITLASRPSLPNDEILAQVLFGRSASQLSPVEAAQLGSALSSLTGGGGLDVIGNLRSFAGLDRLAFAGGGSNGVSVSGGKYLTDDIYIELTGGGRDGPSAQVEWRIRRNLSILSRLAGQAGNRLAVRWRKDY